MAADHAWSGLKPSRARAVDPAGRSDHQQNHAGSSSLRGTEWVPSWATATPKSPDEMTSWMAPWNGAAPGHGTPASLPGAPARWKGQENMPLARSSPAQQQEPHRQGWNPRLTSSPRWGTDRRLHRFSSSPCSETKLDAEMAMFELQITRTVSDNLSLLAASISPAQSPRRGCSTSPRAAAPLDRRSSRGPDLLKRKRSGLSESEEFQGECGWSHPLKLVVRKRLTVSDVKELSRIILPKKEAESPYFPRIDSKEGAVLEMEDYTASKRWCFRFKYWINNKSRMYVLENTGEFVKYHNLKDQDSFTVYEDACKNLVVFGQKRNRADNLDSSLELEGCPPETPTTSASEDERHSEGQYQHE